MTGAPLEYRSAETPRSNSRAGIASLLLGVLCLVGLFFSLIARPANQSSQNAAGPSPAVAQAIALACLACPVLGAVLGVVGLRSRERKRITAILGLCLNGFVLLILATAVGYALFAMR